MKRVRAFGVWGASIVITASWLYACSSSSNGIAGGGETPDATSGDNQDDGGGSLGTDDSGATKSKSEAGAGDSGGTGVCGASATANDCYACCDTVASDGGVSDFFNIQFACICNSKKCGTASKCKNTLCADPNTDDAGAKCSACEDKIFADDAGDAGCNDPVFDECAADPTCAAGITCVVDSNCDSLP